MARVTGTTVARLAFNAGFRGVDIIIAVAVARGESEWNVTARNLTTREDSRGLWQINVRAHPWGRNINLYNGQTNAYAARAVHRGAGDSWRPWSVYVNGTWIKHLLTAWNAVRGTGVGVTETHWRAAQRLARSQHPAIATAVVAETVRWALQVLEPLLAPSMSHEPHLRAAAGKFRTAASVTRGRARNAYDHVRKRL